MSKPQGTYLKIQSTQRIAGAAADAKTVVASSRDKERAQFFRALDRMEKTRLSRWHREMNGLAEAIRKSQPLSNDDKTRKAVSDVLGEVRKLLVQVKDYQALESTLQRPATAVMRAPRDLGLAGAELTLVIALVQVLAIFVRMRGDKTRR